MIFDTWLECQDCGNRLRKLTPSEAQSMANKPYNFVVLCQPCARDRSRPENVECPTCGGSRKVEGMNHGPADLLFNCPACSRPENVDAPT